MQTRTGRVLGRRNDVNADIEYLEEHDELLVKQDMTGSDWWSIYLPNGEAYDTKPVGFLHELRKRGHVKLINLYTDEEWAA